MADSAVKHVVSVLRTALDQIENSPLNETQPPSVPSTLPTTSGQQSFVDAAQRDFRKAFPGLCSRNVTRPRITASNSRSSPDTEQPPKKKPLKGYVPLRFQPLETWTHEICILGRCDESHTPDRDRLDTLMAAGLGKVKVVFPNKNASHEELRKFMEEKFPKLKGSGGFEVLRAVGGGGGQRSLSLIPPGREGYSVPHLKERLGQAIAYFRPLQANLDERKVKLENAGPVIKCIKCNGEFTYGDFKNHQYVCGLQVHGDNNLSINSCDPELEIIESNERIDDDTGVIACAVPVGNKVNSQGSLAYLKDVFPHLSIETLQNLLDSKFGSVSDVIDEVIGTDNDFETDEFPDFGAMMKSDVDGQLDLSALLQKLAPTKLIPHRLSVNRESLFQDSVSLFKKSSFDFESPVKIIFENEPAIDGGGPRREYFTLLMRCLVSPTNVVRLFEGNENRLIPMHNTDALRANMFKVAGRMIAASIVNGCPGFPCLSPAVYSYLVTGSCQGIDIVTDDLPDLEIREIVTLIDSMEDFANIPEIINDALVETGFTKRLAKANKLEAITSVMLNSVILSRKAELDQFSHGLGPVLKEARAHPDIFKPLFVHGDVCLTPGQFKSLLLDKDLDCTIKGYFYQFIEQQDEEALQKLLAFCTGASTVPPMGFHDPDFITVTTTDSTLPNANTCPMELELPANVSNFDEFSRQMKLALDIQAHGFGII